MNLKDVHSVWYSKSHIDFDRADDRLTIEGVAHVGGLRGVTQEFYTPGQSRVVAEFSLANQNTIRPVDREQAQPRGMP